MNEQEQRNAIAEFCGWTRHVVQNADADGPILDGKTMIRWTAPGEVLNRNPYWNRREPLDYLNDLNAIHEAENLLDVDIESGDSPRYVYSYYLYNIVRPEQQPCRATAKQRAEALLRTLGLWKD